MNKWMTNMNKVAQVKCVNYICIILYIFFSAQQETCHYILSVFDCPDIPQPLTLSDSWSVHPHTRLWLQEWYIRTIISLYMKCYCVVIQFKRKCFTHLMLLVAHLWILIYHFRISFHLNFFSKTWIQTSCHLTSVVSPDRHYVKLR